MQKSCTWWLLLMVLATVYGTSLQALRRHTILTYDTTAFDFAGAVKAVLESKGRPINVSLSHLHETHEGRQMLVDKSGARINYYQTLWNRDRHLEPAERGAAFLRFDQLYRDFIRSVIGPSVGGGRVLYQRAPTLRCYIPGDATAMGVFHTDEEYHHQPSELNLWMPLSDQVHGTNTLHVESAPGQGDFSPLNLNYGECFRGWLNQCRHGCYPNTSGRTRLSLDFRVVNEATGGHDPSFRAGIRRGAKSRFQNKFDVGGFYDEANIQESAPILANTRNE